MLVPNAYVGASKDSFERQSLQRVNLVIETGKRQQIEVFLRLTLQVETRIYATVVFVFSPLLSPAVHRRRGSILCANERIQRACCPRTS
jgi:hypothetical protein